MSQSSWITLFREGVGRQCPPCAKKDFSEVCPLGWTELEDAKCVAPKDYAGFCAPSQPFGSFGMDEKKEAEATCGVCWPCMSTGDCKRNWKAPCPNGYSPTSINSSSSACISQSPVAFSCGSYSGSWGGEDAQVFSRRCGAPWPCQRQCESFSPCPEGWSKDSEDLCMAPAYYSVSGCPTQLDFRTWSREEKEEFGEKCRVQWLCGPHADSASCGEIDFSACPENWAPQGLNECSPPLDARGPCAAILDLMGMTTDEKRRKTNECGLQWPCRASGLQDGPSSF